METLVHGIDLVEIARIDRMLREHGDRFVDRCFTETERLYAEAGSRRRGERYAARFAAKEAALKALGTGWRDGIAWQDVAIEREPSGQPRLRIYGEASKVAESLGVRCWLVSLSHTDTHAIASVIGCG